MPDILVSVRGGMLTFTWLLIGLALAMAFVALLRRFPVTTERHMSALGLLVAALIYLLLALLNGGPIWSLIEAAGVIVYGALAWLGLRRSILWLAAGWALHPLWDLALHLTVESGRFVPAWYVVACLSFDAVLVGYLITARQRLQTNVGTCHPPGQESP